MSATTNNNAAKKLFAVGIRPLVLCNEFATRYSESHIDEVIAAARKRASRSVAGWTRKALADGWIVTPEVIAPAAPPQLTPEQRRQQAIEDNRRNRERIAAVR